MRLLALLPLLCLMALAGEKPKLPPAFFSKAKENGATPAELLQAFEAAPETDYTLGDGDEFELTVWDRPELSGKHVIGPDGKVTLPYAGLLQAAGLTREALADAAKQKWAAYYNSLNATVRVLRYDSNRIFVLGRVANPGVLRFESQITLLEAVTRAGGLPIGGLATDKAALTRCLVFRGRDKLVWIDLKSLLNGSNLTLNLHLQRNDTLYLPDSEDQVVYVMGEVKRPGPVRLTSDLTFLGALAQAGGTTDEATSRARLIRPSTAEEGELDLRNFYKSSRAINPSLQDGDILYVGKNGAAKVGYIFQKLGPLTGWLVTGAALGK